MEHITETVSYLANHLLVVSLAVSAVPLTLGILLCLYGYRLYKPLSMIYGAVAGLAMGAVAAYAMHGKNWPIIGIAGAVGAALGVLGGLLMMHIRIALMCALPGLLGGTALGLAVFRNDFIPALSITAGLGIISLMAFWKHRHYFVMLSTSIEGAQMATGALAYPAAALAIVLGIYDFPSVAYATPLALLIFASTALALFGIGMWKQVRDYRSRSGSRTDAKIIRRPMDNARVRAARKAA
ncbi:MAG: TM7S3/TM198-like domain-containing protein [Planctomycetota bacterium]|jgi:hypothetical protein